MSTFTRHAQDKTVAELKTIADQWGVKYNTKTRKADLIAAIDSAIDETEGNSDSPSPDLHWQEVGHTSSGETVYTAPMGTRPDEGTPWMSHSAVAPKRTGERGKVKGKVMGLHYRGRALGLKHYQAMGLVIGRTAPKRGHSPILSGFIMPNSERVQNYARQRGTHGVVTDRSPVAKLTHRQMRRVMKAADKHGDGFMYRTVWTPGMPEYRFYPAEGYSLLARTPEGLGIFYRFSK